MENHPELTITYAYDTCRIGSLCKTTDISYNGANQLTGWTWSDGTAYTKTYDTNGRLKTFPLGDQTRTLSYDKLGNITGWSNSNGASKTFSYDLLSRLTGYTKTQDNQTEESQTFSYDANGNRLNLTENKDTAEEIQTVYSILENSNRLTKVADTDYQYDQNGNIINDGEHSYSYDARNRLIQVASSTLSGVEGSYLYNANNMRVRKTTQKGTTLYGWDNDRIFAEYDENGNAVQETVYFGSTPIALLKDNSTYRIYADQIDTPRVITENQTNQTLWAWTSKPFGESKPNEDVDGDQVALNYNLRFPGQYYDQETGKHYNFNRDYDPVTGRYVQTDPIGLDGGMNIYVYSLSKPLNNYDMEGLDVAVINSSRADWSWNVFGHVAMAVTNKGVYSWGTYHALGSSVWRYIYDENGESTTYISFIKTTPQQDTNIIAWFKRVQARGYDIRSGNTCATAVSEALEKVGVPNFHKTRLPVRVADMARNSRSNRGAFVIPQDTDMNSDDYYDFYVRYLWDFE